MAVVLRVSGLSRSWGSGEGRGVRILNVDPGSAAGPTRLTVLLYEVVL